MCFHLSLFYSAVSFGTRKNGCWGDFAAPGLPLLTPFHRLPPHPHIRVLTHFIDRAIFWTMLQWVWRGLWTPLFRLGCQQLSRQVEWRRYCNTKGLGFSNLAGGAFKSWLLCSSICPLSSTLTSPLPSVLQLRMEVPSEQIRSQGARGWYQKIHWTTVSIDRRHTFTWGVWKKFWIRPHSVNPNHHSLQFHQHFFSLVS